MSPSRSTRWWCAYYGLAYALGLVVLCGHIPSWGRWFSASLWQHAQVRRLAVGRLALATDPAWLAGGLCWSQGGVHQVWGLGIPLWRLPLDLWARLVGLGGAPDRLAAALFLGLAASLPLREVFCHPPACIPGTQAASGKAGPAANGFWRAAGTVVVVLGFPPFVSLARTGVDIYEEALLYVYACGLVLAWGVVALTRRPTWRRFWGLCALAGCGGLFRPTLVFYGAATLIVAAAVMLASGTDRRSAEGGVEEPHEHGCGRPPRDGGAPRLGAPRGRRVWRLGLGLGLFIAGGALLWLTNLVRFGDGFEFGHRLNVQGGSLLGAVYATRFDHPFQDEPFWSAARELVGALFSVKRLNGGEWYAQDVVGGQSATVRWRQFYFSAYDWSYALLVVAGWAVGVGVWWKWRGGVVRRRPFGGAQGGGAIPTAVPLAAWSLLACLPLAAFYLRTPVLSSRYLMDFAPAFAAAMVVAWWRVVDGVSLAAPSVRWLPRVAFGALVSWVSVEMAGAKSPSGPARSLTWREVKERDDDRDARPAAKALPADYRVGAGLAPWGIPFNGSGWDARSGALAQCVILFVDSPRFLDLELTSAPGATVGRADAEALRAKVGLESLELESVSKSDDRWHVRFAGPTKPRYQRGLQAVFIATVPKERLADSETPWVLKRASWRSPPPDGQGPPRPGPPL